MTTLQIGRMGVDVTHGHPFKISQDEDRLSLSGGLTTEASSAAVMNAFRQNVLGLGEKLDEPIVPVIESGDDQLKGFYRVLGTHVDFPGGAFAHNRFTWEMDLERIPDYAHPAIESTLIGGYRTNVFALSGAGHHYVPSTVLNYHQSSDTLRTDWNITRTLADGNTLKSVQVSSISAAERRLAQFTLKPDDYYVGAARVEVQYGTSTYYRVIGRKIWSNLSAVNWRITNDLIRVTPSATAGRIDVSVWDGAQWDAVKTFKFSTTYAASIIDRLTTFSIIRNTPEEVIVRLGMGDNITGTAAAIERLNLDISLRRGSMMAECVWSADDSVLGTVGVNTVEAATAVTGGIRATSNDAAGNRYLILTPIAKTNDLVNGTITKTAAAAVWSFAFGLERGGSGATSTTYAVSTMQDDYYGVWAETQTVVGR